MGLTVINGLPAHVLLVHFVVVLVPLSALVLVVSAVWPTWIRRLGVALPLLALVTLIFVPLAAHAGEWLQKHTASDPLVRKHAKLGDGLVPWALGLFIVTVAVWWVGRRAIAQSSDVEGSSRSGGVVLSVPIRVAAIALSVIVAAGSVVQVYRIGDSGAKAAWHGRYSAKPVGGNGH